MDWLASDTDYPHMHAIMSVHVSYANRLSKIEYACTSLFCYKYDFLKLLNNNWCV